ncbi:glycoside hydrolase superfamily [Infundibulicybe gibba]|nr:glycoside hydrolase superfamily [Infundibulicybe gibba]
MFDVGSWSPEYSTSGMHFFPLLSIALSILTKRSNLTSYASPGIITLVAPLLTTTDDVDATFKEMQEAGGFNAINATELAGAKSSGLTYYQVWDGPDWTLNDGPQGLQRLDYVINTAGKYGIKIILAFTNNWWGAELYINWIAEAGVLMMCFIQKKIISSFRDRPSPNIFAWELVNEARCLGDLPSGPACVPGTNLLNTWYKQQSNFVRSLDPHHMITTGGEGHFFWKHPVAFWFNHTLVSDYNFNGQAGEDFDLDLTLPNIDFGTYDFPGSNFTVESWGLGWIDDHVRSAARAQKPLILEEFGLGGLENKSSIYPAWVNRALETEHAIMPWQFGATGLKESGGNRLIKYADALINGASPNDVGFLPRRTRLAIYSNQTVWDIFTNAAKIQNARSG